MKAEKFNQRYAVGKVFIHQPNKALRGGHAVRTVDLARDLPSSTVVEINIEPWFVNINSLTPA